MKQFKEDSESFVFISIFKTLEKYHFLYFLKKKPLNHGEVLFGSRKTESIFCLKIAQKGLLQGDLRKEKGGEKNSQKRG